MKAKQQARVIALANQKGGVAKTTTTINLGAGLVALGQRVLIVDIDPQANTTMGLGFDPYSQQYTIYDVLLNPERGAGFAVQPAPGGLAAIPATLDLAAAELELAGKIGRETLLREALLPLLGDYDYILIDPPPSLGLFTLNALAAAQEVVIPLQVHIYALKGMAQLQKTVGLVQKINPGLRITGVVCTMVDKRNTLARQVEETIRAKLGDLVFTTTIPLNTRLAEAPASGTPIQIYDANSSGARAYTALAKEVHHAQA